MQNSANLSSDLPLGQFAKVEVQDGFEGPGHVRGCGKEFGQARIRTQLPPELFSYVISGPMAVGMLTGEYSPSVHGPVPSCALSIGLLEPTMPGRPQESLKQQARFVQDLFGLSYAGSWEPEVSRVGTGSTVCGRLLP
jgi:hypothetical protein